MALAVAPLGASVLLVLVPSAGAALRADGAPARVSVAANLTARQVVPPPVIARRPSGFFHGRLQSGRGLIWSFAAFRLSGVPTAAHIHIGLPGKQGAILLRLCLPQPCRLAMEGTVAGIGAQSSLWKQLVAGKAYVDIHTRRNPRGEIRGQIAGVEFG